MLLYESFHRISINARGMCMSRVSRLYLSGRPTQADVVPGLEVRPNMSRPAITMSHHVHSFYHKQGQTAVDTKLELAWDVDTSPRRQDG